MVDQRPGYRLPDPPADDQAARRVWRGFVRDGRIVRLPARRGRRLVLLDEVAQLFEPGLRYPEAEVNARLAALYPDYAALRRYLVDELFLARDHGIYWRTGGRVDPDDISR